MYYRRIKDDFDQDDLTLDLQDAEHAIQHGDHHYPRESTVTFDPDTGILVIYLKESTTPIL